MEKNNQIQLDTLTAKQYIAFPWSYSDDDNQRIKVTRVTSNFPKRQRLLVHFLYGCKSISEHIPYSEVIAVGNPHGGGKLPGWAGGFDILNKEHPLLKEN